MKINNKDKDFYRYLGPIFGSREVQKKTGDRFYDDDGKDWYIHLESGHVDVSVSILKGKIRNVYSENEKELTEILKEIHHEVSSGMIPVVYLKSFIKAGYTVGETKTKKRRILFQSKGDLKMELNEIIEMLCDKISEMETVDEKADVLNKVRIKLHEVSPFKNEPCDCTLWVKQENVKANEYNPNHVATPEMKLLYESVKCDGYTMPIVTYDLKDGTREIVDGFHRNRVGREHPDIKARIHGYLPVTTIDKPEDERMASTIRHNRARGTHGIRPMSEIVIELAKNGWSDEKICKEIGMDLDEVIRLKQITGLKDAFMNHEFSKSWEEFESKYYK